MSAEMPKAELLGYDSALGPCTCGNCIFWHTLSEAKENGFCRRHAPTPYPGDLANPEWPITDAVDWCGEGGTKEKPAETPFESLWQKCQRPGLRLLSIGLGGCLYSKGGTSIDEYVEALKKGLNGIAALRQEKGNDLMLFGLANELP